MKVISLKPLTVDTEPVLGHARLWETLEPVECRWEVEGRTERMVVPAGFRTDGPSIPRIVRPLIEITNIEWAASVCHDYRYQWQIGSRRFADLLFRECLAYTREHWGLDGLDRPRYWAKHELAVVPAVRIGGWWKWMT